MSAPSPASAAAPAKTTTPNNNLIDITTLAQLDAIRYNLGGDGASIAKGAPSGKYAKAFPGLTTGLGCPATCTGYELMANLDFNTDGAPGVTSSDVYPNWTPIVKRLRLRRAKRRICGCP